MNPEQQIDPMEMERRTVVSRFSSLLGVTYDEERDDFCLPTDTDLSRGRYDLHVPSGAFFDLDIKPTELTSDAGIAKAAAKIGELFGRAGLSRELSSKTAEQNGGNITHVVRPSPPLRPKPTMKAAPRESRSA